MARVVFDAVTKRFGDVGAVRDFSLKITDGEFVVLVGPSGRQDHRLAAWLPGSRR
jgi:multiple sugar transport system ATP-binding protein